MSITVLICDDNEAVHASLSKYLHEAHFQVISSYTGEDILKIVSHKKVDVVILDLMLPRKSGIEILRELRAYTDIPILILSAKEAEVDRILGLELGADDYITKPFSPREVVTRVSVILKRCNKKIRDSILSYSNLTIDLTAYAAYVNDIKLDLTPKEFQLLSFFASAPGEVQTREKILNKVWGYDYYGDVRTIDTQIKHIRQKLPNEAAFTILSVYGVGYKLEAK